jgi:hypothetical protein
MRGVFAPIVKTTEKVFIEIGIGRRCIELVKQNHQIQWV